MIGSYLTVFYSDVVGLAPAVISVIMLIARIWQALSDPIFGGVAEENNFYLHQGSTCWRDDDCKDFVTGFSVSGSPIPPGAGTLFHLNYAEIGDDFFDENISVNDLTCLDITEGTRKAVRAEWQDPERSRREVCPQQHAKTRSRIIHF